MSPSVLPGRAVLVVAFVVFMAITAGCSTQAPDSLAMDWRLTVNGTTEKVLTMDDLKALPSEEGHGYCVSTTGFKFGPYTCKGADLRDVADLVGGISQGQQVWVSAPDGYLWVFDYDQMEGRGFVTMNENLTEVPSPPLRIILMYEQDGKPLSYDDGGPARIAIISDHPGVVTEGSSWVKWVDRIEVKKGSA